MAETIKQHPVIVVTADNQVVIGQGYSLGQILAAIELARRSVLGVVLRPDGNEAQANVSAPA